MTSAGLIAEKAPAVPVRPLRQDVGRSLLLTVGIMMVIGTALDLTAPFIRFNWTPSLPYGIYLRTNDPSAPDVEFCISRAQAQDVPLMQGDACPSGLMPLMKPIIRGDHDIELAADGMRVDGKLLPNTAPLARTHEGKPLHHAPFGHYIADREHIWVASSYNALSFDSRYFGSLSPKDIREYERPLLVFPLYFGTGGY